MKPQKQIIPEVGKHLNNIATEGYGYPNSIATGGYSFFERVKQTANQIIRYIPAQAIKIQLELDISLYRHIILRLNITALITRLRDTTLVPAILLHNTRHHIIGIASKMQRHVSDPLTPVIRVFRLGDMSLHVSARLSRFHTYQIDMSDNIARIRRRFGRIITTVFGGIKK